MVGLFPLLHAGSELVIDGLPAGSTPSPAKAPRALSSCAPAPDGA